MSTKLRILAILVITFLAYSYAGIVTNNEVDVSSDYQMIYGVQVYRPERQCAMVGGICVHTRDCNAPTSNKGLCPSNAHLGVECCYELPVRPTPCREQLGECMNRCPLGLQRPNTDCTDGQYCCVLV